VAAIGQPELLCMRRHQGDLIKLAHAAVFIVQALNQQQRRCNAPAFGANIKAAKRRRQPDIIPLPERTVDVSMMPGQPLAQAVAIDGSRIRGFPAMSRCAGGVRH
jgi:hypothetical protein